MPSTLGWIAYDSREQESMTRVLALFREKESRDELGLGGIRDSIADQLFPGTSTIQTRLRYMLFVPWIYRRLEEQRISSDEISRVARKRECALITPLLDENEAGVLGRLAGNQLKRLPSAVYWNGMSSWGLLVYPGSQSDYHRMFDRLHVLRSSARRRDDQDLLDEYGRTWHEGLPEPPAEFPEVASFPLRRVEAEYLRDRICERHPDSLLAWLVRDPEPPPEAEYIWAHPRRASFSAEQRELVHHAHVFAVVMEGAAVLYNLELARLRGTKKLIDEHHQHLEKWVDEIGSGPLREQVLDWSLVRFWALVCGRGSSISEQSRWFVEGWTQFVRAGTIDAVDGDAPRKLIRSRESLLKRAQSRFHSQRALEQWSGYAGLGIATYRWRNALTFLRDFSDGFANEEEP